MPSSLVSLNCIPLNETAALSTGKPAESFTLNASLVCSKALSSCGSWVSDSESFSLEITRNRTVFSMVPALSLSVASEASLRGSMAAIASAAPPCVCSESEAEFDCTVAASPPLADSSALISSALSPVSVMSCGESE